MALLLQQMPNRPSKQLSSLLLLLLPLLDCQPKSRSPSYCASALQPWQGRYAWCHPQLLL
jgi:hypothetical protein